MKSGDVLVIRYEGPKRGGGMREMLTPTSLLSGMGVEKEVALITQSAGNPALTAARLSAMKLQRQPAKVTVAAVERGIS